MVGAFTKSGNIWAFSTTLVPTVAVSSALFGYSVSVSGDGKTAVVGAQDFDPGSLASAGQVYVFTDSGSGWDGGVILATGTVASQKLGSSVSVSSDGKAVGVGAAGFDPGSMPNAGQVSVFIKSGTSWVAGAGTILGTGAVTNSRLGYSVAASGDGTEVMARPTCTRLPK